VPLGSQYSQTYKSSAIAKKQGKVFDNRLMKGATNSRTIDEGIPGMTNQTSKEDLEKASGLLVNQSLN